MQKSTKSLLAIIATGLVLVAVVRVLEGTGTHLGDVISDALLYLALVLGLVIFLGNIIVTGFWLIMSERSRSQDVLRHAAKVVNWADVYFTAPGVYLIVLSGLVLAERFGGHSTGWILAATITFALSGVVWLLALIPTQNRMVKLASAPDTLDHGFHRLLHKWYIWGSIATVLPPASVALTVVRP